MESPYVLFLGDVTELSQAKTAAGLVQWRPELCLGQMRLEGCEAGLGLPDLSCEEAVSKGIKTLVIGVVNVGGFIPEHWKPTIVEALKAGLDVASGMHNKLNDDPVIKAAAIKYGRSLYDVRHHDREFSPGTGARRAGKRILTVGIDCVVGKKFTALAIEKEMKRRDIKVDFRATGQTGVLIAGRGVAIDAVVADFISGAAEWLSPDNEADHWDIIEGQGSLFHPAYAGVTLGLIHGSQPDGLVICHEPKRNNLLGLDYPVVDLKTCIDRNVEAAQLTNPLAKAVGVSINSSRLDSSEIDAVVEAIEQETGLPCCDPLVHGTKKIVDYILAEID